MSESKPAAIQLKNVSLVRQDVTILEDIEWSVPPGTMAAILGPNGSGKTTLTRVLVGYEWPTSGTVDVLGHRLGQTDLRELRRLIQVINPAERYGVDPNLSTLDAVLTGYFASLYLYEEVTAGQRDHAAHLLETVGLGHRITHPFGLLSTGEQRRCLLARALVRIPRVLILDEPTAGLDVAGREHLLATLDQLHRIPDPPTVLFVTHHVEELSPLTERVMLLSGGRMMGSGPPDELITPESLSTLFGCRVYVQKRSGRFWLEVLPEAWLDLVHSDRQRRPGERLLR